MSTYQSGLRNACYKIEVIKTTAQSIPNSGSAAIVTLDTIRANIGGFTLSGGRITIPYAGLYRVAYRGGASNASNTVPAWSQWFIYKNGNVVLGSNLTSFHFASTTVGFSSASGEILNQCVAGDVIDLRVLGLSGSNLNTWVCNIVVSRVAN